MITSIEFSPDINIPIKKFNNITDNQNKIPFDFNLNG